MKEKNYIQSMMDFAVCNHTRGVTENNIGYVGGMLDGEIPFEAELFQYGENNDLQKEISVLMPIIKNRSELDCTQNNKGNVIGFEYEIEINDMSVLTVGMVENGQESDENTIRYYVELLENSGIIQFTGNLQSGSVFYFTDVNGNEFAQVHMGLITCGNQEAVTPLKFRKFPLKNNHSDRKNFGIVK